MSLKRFYFTWTAKTEQGVYYREYDNAIAENMDEAAKIIAEKKTI